MDIGLWVSGWDVPLVADGAELLFVNDSVKQQVEAQELDRFIR